ncbi:LOW QUALITY PROTEIN: uncharacterized protein [Cicer arietinum]|uniref:LOW QUALITY PROTEIN: uncharacterized protein n=1 Tax=Cicer arietinum TaxID=3827 RepID=UPI003CC52BFE
MKYHVKYIIFNRTPMPKKMLLHFFHPHLHLKVPLFRNGNSILFKFGISFSKTKTANDSQFKTSKKGGTKSSDIITGTHSYTIASTTLGLLTSYPFGQTQYLLLFMY